MMGARKSDDSSRLVTNAGGREGNAREGGRRERGAGGELGGRDVPGRTIRGTLRSAPRPRTGSRGRRSWRCGWTRRIATNCSTPPRGSTRRARRRPPRAATRGASSRARRRVARGASPTPNARRALRPARCPPRRHKISPSRTAIARQLRAHWLAQVVRGIDRLRLVVFASVSSQHPKRGSGETKRSGLKADRYPIDRRSNRRSTAR
jgi:hypothetical protein